jgi:hypothetical protein
MDCGEEISGGFVVARGDSAELLQLAVEVLDEVTRLVSGFVIGALGWLGHQGPGHGQHLLLAAAQGAGALIGPLPQQRELRERGVLRFAASYRSHRNTVEAIRLAQ